ncbi:hypothetical protein Zmor_020420 [Zophobas morio]|uniref:Gustatory receptor n=1 Tax=Zophobas morio TaxID=2755281 RepID=A0AA38I7K8_9CUCU|nr:hypothetical protein Zmor_020420 [Zophobas morio]
MITNFCVFYKRTPQLKLLLFKIYTTEGPTKQLSNYLKLYFVLLTTVNLMFACSQILGLSVPLQLSINIPIVANVFELVFVGDVISTLQEKFRSVNKLLQMEQEHLTRQSICRLQKISHQHYDLVGLAKQANYIFGVTFLTGMATLVCSAIDGIYFTLYIYANYSNNFESFKFFVFNIIWLGSQISWLYVLIKLWSDSEEEANAVSGYIHDMWNKYTTNNDLCIYIRHLELIAIRCAGTKVKFTAKDFVPLDWNLMHTVVAALATYVVILIQFKF